MPGLLGKPVDIPDYLFESDAIASHDREIPVVGGGAQDNAVALIAPLDKPTAEFSVGPNPAGGQSDAVSFYFQGKRIKSGKLSIYDASGNFINKINVRDDAIGGGNGRRVVGSWNLTDAKGRRVTGGNYLVKGRILKQDGSAAGVSSIIVIRN